LFLKYIEVVDLKLLFILNRKFTVLWKYRWAAWRSGLCVWLVMWRSLETFEPHQRPQLFLYFTLLVLLSTGWF